MAGGYFKESDEKVDGVVTIYYHVPGFAVCGHPHRRDTNSVAYKSPRYVYYFEGT